MDYDPNMSPPHHPPAAPPPIGFAVGDDHPLVGFEGLGPPGNGPAPAQSPGGGLYPNLPPNGGTTEPPVNITENPIGFEGTDDPEADLMGRTEDDEAQRKQELEEKRNSLKFLDGQRQIDFVLVYQDSSDAEHQEKKEAKRKFFESKLQEEGLELEYEDKKMSQDGKTHYVKVHAPWEVLSRMAEILATKMPIKDPHAGRTIDYGTFNKEYEETFANTSCLSCLPNPFVLPEHIVKAEDDYFTADFSREREAMFIIDDKDTFFTRAQRSTFTYELLLRTQYEEAKDKIGIDRLMSQSVYVAAYPLHEGPYKSEKSMLVHGPMNDRHNLYEAWARPGRWYFEQPVDLIRRYFGEKIGIYFVWLGFYTTMLIPAAIVGLIVFLYGVITLYSNHPSTAPSEEICDASDAGNFTMCPLCDRRCSYWRLGESCMYSRLTYMFDNYATVFFACFMAIWATMFLEFWKRRQAELQYDWDVAGYELEERMRPEYEATVSHRKLNPITQMMEPFLPLWNKIPRWVTSLSVILFMICCVLAVVFGVIMYRIIVVTLFYAAEQDIIRQNAKLTTSCTAACISLLGILILNKLYTRVAFWLTELERPRTDSEYEDSFTFKMYLFQFINYYSSIFYIAFIKGRYTARPGNYAYLHGYRAEECDPAGCLNELCIQLGVVMIGKQFLNNSQELLIPMFQNWFKNRKAKQEDNEDNLFTRWEQDKRLVAVPYMCLFNEYLEMVIQYGFVTIFVAAFPLAPLAALINNVIEIRLDAYKYVTQLQRPVATRAQDIGIWYGILQGVTFIAVLSNALIIGWTSDFVPKLVYQYTVSPDRSMVGYMNHSLSYFAVKDFQNQSFPDDPQSDIFGVVDECRYSDYREPPGQENEYKYTAFYWHVFTARLAFIICFEHVVFFCNWLVAYLVPDVPRNVKQLMLREIYIAKEARYSSTFANVHKDKVSRLARDESLAEGFSDKEHLP